MLLVTRVAAALLCWPSCGDPARPGNLEIRFELEPGATRPSYLVVSWLHDQGAVFLDRRIPRSGELASEGAILATMIIETDPSIPGERRIVVRGMREALVVVEGASRIPESAAKRTLTVTLRAERGTDRDDDGIPDEVDNCPSIKDPTGACRGSMTDAATASSDAAADTRVEPTAADTGGGPIDGQPIIRPAVDASRVEVPGTPADAALAADTRVDAPPPDVAADRPIDASPIDASPVDAPADGPQGTGLKGEYFSNPTLTGPATVVRVDPTVSFDWASGAPAPGVPVDSFTVRWTGEVEAQFTEGYTIKLSSDDGSSLWWNGALLIDRFTGGSGTGTGVVPLEAGRRYPIRLEMQEMSGTAGVSLTWSSASRPSQVIPRNRLYPAP
jgi:hypothetical protein